MVTLVWLSRSAARWSMGSPPSDQNFSVPLIRRLICLTVDSIGLLVIGRPCLRYSLYFIRWRWLVR